MQTSNLPARIPAPFAVSGVKNTIPLASLIGTQPGNASFADGFPPLTRTPKAGGGIPPSGLDMNGILFQISAVTWWLCAGGGFPYDATFSGQINGYPLGARLLRADGTGFWISTVENNSTNPDAGGAGWIPDGWLRHGCCKLGYVSATQIELFPFGGNGLIIDGVIRAVPTAHVTASNSGLAASTLYYVYAYMNAGVMTLQFSATGHVGADSGVEVKSGDASKTLVGMVYTNASSQFTESNTSRCVASWFNRRQKPVATGGTSFSTSATSFAASGIKADFVSWEADATLSIANGTGSNATAGAAVNSALALDSAPSSSSNSSGFSTTANQATSMTSVVCGSLAEGRHTLEIYASANTGTASIVMAIQGTVNG